MEESWTNWLCNLESNDYNFINDCINATDGNFQSHITPTEPFQEENLQPSFSANSSHCSYATTLNAQNSSNMSNSSVNESSLELRPAKLLKTGTKNLLQERDLASFDKVNAQIYRHHVDDSGFKPKNKGSVGNIATKSSTLSSNGTLESQKNETRNNQECKRTPSHAQDHIIAERMRREKITQQFIALSALIPGLKKMNKASVLGDAIKYVKQLQEHVKLLEEQTKRRSVESAVVIVKKSHLSTNEDISDTSSNSCNDNCNDSSKWNRSLPEVEARVSENDVLIRIHCAKQKGLLVNILREIDNLNLSVINTSVLPFGTSILDITIVAQKHDEFRLTVKELATNLKVSLFGLTSGSGS